jgi:hypothetical protein
VFRTNQIEEAGRLRCVFELRVDCVDWVSHGRGSQLGRPRYFVGSFWIIGGRVRGPQ